jgi:hypothetical protein
MFNFFRNFFSASVIDDEEYISVKRIKVDEDAAARLEQKRLKAIETLGDKWILKNKIQKKS